MLSLIGLDIVSTVRVRTNSGDATYFETKLPEFSAKDIDVLIDDRTKKIRIGRVDLSFKSKDVLEALFKLFVTNPGKYFSKEELTTRIWHESYNPLVHDPRIYTSIRRLRQILSGIKKTDWIKESAGKYSISSRIRYAVISTTTVLDGLNERQKWIMDFLKSNDYVDRNTISQMMKTSATVAKTDLKDLVERGMIENIGKGKATKYRQMAHH